MRLLPLALVLSACAKAPPAAVEPPPPAPEAVEAVEADPNVVAFRYQGVEEDYGVHFTQARLQGVDDAWHGHVVHDTQACSTTADATGHAVTCRQLDSAWQPVGTPTDTQVATVEQMKLLSIPGLAFHLSSDGTTMTVPAEPLEALGASVRERLETAVPEGEERDRVMAMVEPMLSVETQRQLMAAEWSSGAGFFLGADLELGQVYETPPVPMDLPLLPGVQLPAERLFAALERVPCHYDDLATSCVETAIFETVSSVTDEMNAALADAGLPQLAAHEHAKERWMVLDPATLMAWTEIRFEQQHTTIDDVTHDRLKLTHYARTHDGQRGYRAPEGLTLPEARAAHTTQLVAHLGDTEPPVAPVEGSGLLLVDYPSGEATLPAYLTADPGDGDQHPAIVWLEGGHPQVLFDPTDGLTDGASAFRDAGMAVLFPGMRGGHPGTGEAEGFLGEVDDVIAAAEHLATLPWVDPQRIYLGGHSSGATLALLTAASTDRFAGVVAFGPVDHARRYGGDLVFTDPSDVAEMRLRSPAYWMHTIATPTWLVEGEEGNATALMNLWAANDNDHIAFVVGEGHDHFTLVAPAARTLAEQWVGGGEGPSQAALTQALTSETR